MRVPVGGAMCANCSHYKPTPTGHGLCREPNFAAYYGTNQIPFPADEFCSDWYEPTSGTRHRLRR
jgi:hypothetical protein